MNKAVILSRLNKWWQTGKVDSSFRYKAIRSEFELIKAALQEERILSIIGPRRVGKSTLIYQTIDYLLKSKLSANRVLFFSGDDPLLFSDNCTIGDIIETYANEILHESVYDLDERIYLFIDEIHVIKDWQLWLKSYYDKKCKIKFVISGSSSTHLFDGSKESLLGRYESVQIMPMSFFQFCSFWAVYNEDEKVATFLKEIPKGSIYTDLQAYYSELEKKQWILDEYKPYVNKALKEYLLIGGYPEYFVVKNHTSWQKRLVEDIIGQGLYRDIISIYHIKNPELLEKMLYFITATTGQQINYTTISDTLGCDNETVSNYLSFLSKAYLVVALDNFSTNVGKIIRKRKTVYTLDNGIGNALLHFSEIDETREGHLIETLCVRDVLSVCEQNFWKLYYWRDGDDEVDIVVDKKTSVLPIEVKFRKETTSREDGVKKFIKKFSKKVKIEEAVLITKDTLVKRDRIYHIPFWLTK
ncbi:MAG: ATP-binding protein [Clostridia bacterium]|nr:ATP-binding protein [Clostridia bacterium]MDD4049232.1 ATP-binding protein [Clostridia bacterium]